ncbi:MAG: putative quinol monooxygenase [Terriglobales bacterium]
MFVLLVQFTVYRGKEEQAKDLMRKMEEHTRREPGCQLYIASQSNEDPRRFCFYEQYVDQKALEAHRAAPYFAQYVTNGLGPLMESVERETFTTVSS